MHHQHLTGYSYELHRDEHEMDDHDKYFHKLEKTRHDYPAYKDYPVHHGSTAHHTYHGDVEPALHGGHIEYPVHEEDYHHHGDPLKTRYHDVVDTPNPDPHWSDYDHMMQAGWGWDHYDPYHVDPRHQYYPQYGYHHGGYYLDTEQELDENQYLALYGAKELFGQLAGEAPRPKKSRRTRQNGTNSDSDSEPSDDESDQEGSTEPSTSEQDSVSIPQMNLAGAAELFA